ncbi:AMP-binding protein [Rhodoblastus sp.]|uniref:AMP-binding protein n=1 Tax=Rhodoblastus sp. TaxID=1962975 RepID=UPI002608B048|nr:AMP-binding protein [Rhodoblastus sp.]
MERIWLSQYPAGVDPDVDVRAFPSLVHMFEDAVRRFPRHPAFISMSASLTYAQLDALAQRFGAFLQNVARLPRGARVALMMPNLLQYPVALFGALRAGYIIVNCNPLYTPRELEQQLKDSGAEAIVVLENFAATVAEVVARASLRQIVVARVGDLLGPARGALANFVVRHVKKLVPRCKIPGAIRFTQALRLGAHSQLRPIALGPDDLAFLQYTGGTTGEPKGVELTHGNLIANVQQGYAWLRPFLGDGCETIVTPLPLYHIFALTVSCLLFLRIGAANLLIANPRDIPDFVKTLAKHRFSVIIGVDTLFSALLNNADFRRLDFSGLKVSVAGGMALHKAVAATWREVTGRTLVEGYGLTEASPAAIINPLDLADYNGAIGLPMPQTDISIRDDEGVELPIGAAGELCIKGPQVMRGYWRRPDETALVMFPDGFVRTGDIAVVDEKGFVRIVDRKKDMIVVSGFNVYPNEVEDVVAMNVGVLEVGAVGVPDPRSGEAVKIVVVRKDETLSAEDLIAHCRRHLAGYKIPRYVEFRKELPKTNVGKILRRALRDL